MEAVRSFQPWQSMSVRLAVLLAVLACQTRADSRQADSRQASISPTASFDAGSKLSSRLIRSAAPPSKPLAGTTSEALAHVQSRSSEHAPSLSPGLLTNASLLSARSSGPIYEIEKFVDELQNNKQNLIAGVLNKLNGYMPTPDSEFLLFNWDGGQWDGERNDFDGEVGFEFVPEKDFNITAIGRHVSGAWTQRDDGGINLFERTNVTLWQVLPKNATIGKGNWSNYTHLEDLKLVSMYVGPEDEPDVGGKYRFKYLNGSVPLKAHVKYRITQSCWRNMRDKWFDGIAVETDLDNYGLPECVSVLEGVQSYKRHFYPTMMERMHRRAGMLNFRLETPDGCGFDPKAMLKIPDISEETPAEQNTAKKDEKADEEATEKAEEATEKEIVKHL